MDPEFSFPNNISIHLAPPASGQQKSRAKSMSDDPPFRRRPHHAHRRSAAVSEDLGNMKISISPKLTASTPENPPGVPEDRKVAFIDPPTLIPPLSPTSGNSSTVSPYSPRRSSPRRRTMSTYLSSEEPTCIDLDEALYSKTLHRRTESLPLGLRSPFVQTPRIIETLPEEDEHREREERSAPKGQTTEPLNEPLNEPSISMPPRLAPPERFSSESDLSSGSGSGSTGSSGIAKEKKKRFSFFSNTASPRKSSSPRSRSPLRRLRDPPSVSHLGIPIPDAVQKDFGLSSSAPASVHTTESFSLGEPGPVNPPSPERRNRRSFIASWVARRKELKYL